uniref:Uncharacterized protein n=1 Tax=Molossus molossus TaxID=27622 RepID=A0A7J8FTG0_MOLMO|nr:hypothetical protein HJG59_008336 [Molossus molossus]
MVQRLKISGKLLMNAVRHTAYSRGTSDVTAETKTHRSFTVNRIQEEEIWEFLEHLAHTALLGFSSHASSEDLSFAAGPPLSSHTVPGAELARGGLQARSVRLPALLQKVVQGHSSSSAYCLSGLVCYKGRVAVTLPAGAPHLHPNVGLRGLYQGTPLLLT